VLEGDKPIICAGKRGLVKCALNELDVMLRGLVIYKDAQNAKSWSMGEEEPCIKCGVPMFYTKACWNCPACGFKEGCG